MPTDLAAPDLADPEQDEPEQDGPERDDPQQDEPGAEGWPADLAGAPPAPVQLLHVQPARARPEYAPRRRAPTGGPTVAPAGQPERRRQESHGQGRSPVARRWLSLEPDADRALVLPARQHSEQAARARPERRAVLPQGVRRSARSSAHASRDGTSGAPVPVRSQAGQPQDRLRADPQWRRARASPVGTWSGKWPRRPTNRTPHRPPAPGASPRSAARSDAHVPLRDDAAAHPSPPIGSSQTS